MLMNTFAVPGQRIDLIARTNLRTLDFDFNVKIQCLRFVWYLQPGRLLLVCRVSFSRRACAGLVATTERPARAWHPLRSRDRPTSGTGEWALRHLFRVC